MLTAQEAIRAAPKGAHHQLEPEWGHCDIIPQKIASGPQISPQEDIKRPQDAFKRLPICPSKKRPEASMRLLIYYPSATAPPKKTTSRGPWGRRNGAGLVNNVINATSQCLRLSLVPWGSGLEVQSSSSSW